MVLCAFFFKLFLCYIAFWRLYISVYMILEVVNKIWETGVFLFFDQVQSDLISGEVTNCV